MDDLSGTGPLPAHALWGAAATAFFTALILSPIIRDIFRAYNVVDKPGRRKVHAYPIPRLGGIAIAVAFTAGLFAAPNAETLAWQILPGAAMIFLTGAVDDFFNLKPVHKLFAQLAAGGIAYGSGLRFESFAGHAVPAWIGLPVTVFWLALSTNALNLVDGLDGLCAAISFVAAAAFFFAAPMQGNFALQRAALMLAAAVIGFAGYNWNPATMFLGDSGALLAGFLLGCFGLMWNERAHDVASAAVPALILGIPLLDLGLSILRRFLKRKPLFSADRMHVHHRLLDRGLTPRKAVVVLAGAGAIAAIFAWTFNAVRGAPDRWMLLAASGAGVFLGVWQLRYAEFDVAIRLLARGDFRSNVAKQAWLRNLAEAAGRIRTEDDWWKLLSNAGAEAGWSGMKWVRDQRIARESLLTREKPVWSFAVELGEGESLSIEGSLSSAEPPMDLIAFAEVARTALQRCRETPRQAVTS